MARRGYRAAKPVCLAQIHFFLRACGDDRVCCGKRRRDCGGISGTRFGVLRQVRAIVYPARFEQLQKVLECALVALLRENGTHHRWPPRDLFVRRAVAADSTPVCRRNGNAGAPAQTLQRGEAKTRDEVERIAGSQ